MRLRVAAVSNCGRVRLKNEDNLLIQRKILPAVHLNTDVITKDIGTASLPLMGVFDGMGGYDAGEIASYIAASIARRETFFVKRNETLANRLLRICHMANRAVCEEMQKRQGGRIGTTASMLGFSESRVYLCNVGDSPIFSVSIEDGCMRRISVEHTERTTYEKVTGKKADPKKKFRLTQNIGIFPDELEIEPYCSEEVLHAGDIFLICSDGVTDMLAPPVIEEILLNEEFPENAVMRLLEAAMEAGGTDNITAIVIRAYEEEFFKSKMTKILADKFCRRV